MTKAGGRGKNEGVTPGPPSAAFPTREAEKNEGVTPGPLRDAQRCGSGTSAPAPFDRKLGKRAKDLGVATYW